MVSAEPGWLQKFILTRVIVNDIRSVWLVGEKRKRKKTPREWSSERENWQRWNFPKLLWTDCFPTSFLSQLCITYIVSILLLLWPQLSSLGLQGNSKEHAVNQQSFIFHSLIVMPLFEWIEKEKWERVLSHFVLLLCLQIKPLKLGDTSIFIATKLYSWILCLSCFSLQNGKKSEKQSGLLFWGTSQKFF